MSQIAIPFHIESSYRPEDFLVSDCNREAWLRIHPSGDDEWPKPGVLLRGNKASGKTHLATIWAKENGAVMMSADRLPLDFILEEWFAGKNALLIEDIERITDESLLFHLLNFQRSSDKNLLLTVAEEACWQAFSLPDLRSRLQAMPQVMINQPDDSLVRALIIKCFSDYQRDISLAVIEYLVPRVERSSTAIIELCRALEARANERKQPITVSHVRQALTEC